MFLEKIEQNQTQNVDVVRGMVECLRLAQSASTNQLKIVDICIKLNVIMRGQENKLKDLNSDKGNTSNLFAALDSVIEQSKRDDEEI